MNRRTYLATSGAIGLIGIAGCGDTSSEDSGPDSEQEGPNSDPTPHSQSDSTQQESSSEPESIEDEPELGHLHGITGFTWPSGTDGAHPRRYEWSAVGGNWWYEMDFPRALSEYYTERYSRSREYDMYITDAYGTPYITGLANEFEAMASRNGLSERETANLVIRFVQQMRYTRDDVRTGFDQYAQYPVENLIERGGDCEDSAILLSAILSEMGYGCVLLHMPDVEPEAHMAMGIKGDPSITGSYYEYNGERYYYIEGTDEFAVGEMPNWGGSTSAKIIPVRQSYPTLVYGYGTELGESGNVTVSVEIANQGQTGARNATFHAAFEDENEVFYDETSVSLNTLGNNQSTQQVLQLRPPDDRPLRLFTGVFINGNIHDLSYSDWEQPIA